MKRIQLAKFQRISCLQSSYHRLSNQSGFSFSIELSAKQSFMKLSTFQESIANTISIRNCFGIVNTVNKTCIKSELIGNGYLAILTDKVCCWLTYWSLLKGEIDLMNCICGMNCGQLIPIADVVDFAVSNMNCKRIQTFSGLVPTCTVYALRKQDGCMLLEIFDFPS